MKRLHQIVTNRLNITSTTDVSQALCTDHLITFAPHFVDHLSTPICHTLYFRPTPTTIHLHHSNLHTCGMHPPHLIRPLAPPTFLQTVSSAPAAPPPPKPQTIPDEMLNALFDQFDAAAP
jgi:hypothetical protein